MEATLLSSLHTKLDDLEGKMLAYRCDLISDFQRYYHDLLTGVNPSVATSIQQAIAPSFANYPTLRPELEAADSQTPDPAAFQQALAPEVAARIEAPNSSSRERETELQGLFTPSYLPLLDSSPPHDRRPVATSTVASTATTTATTTSTQTTLAFPLLPVMAPLAADNGTATDHDITADGGLTTTGNSETPADAQAPGEAHRLVRTTTEESTSSVNSDKSDSKTRRSALRRSSSISKPPQSPRRVRFEFMGAEVLPTSSPQQVEFITPAASEPALEDEPIASDMLLGGDIDEWEPPVRKSSSTEALRALSRAPAEEGTVWTVVNPETDGAKSQQDSTNIPAPEKPISADQSTSAAENPRIDTPSAGVVQGSNVTSAASNDVNNHGSENGKDADDSSDDEGDYLAMGKRKPSAAQKSASVSVTQLPEARVSNGLSAAKSTQDKPRPLPSQPSNPRENRNPASVEDESMDDYGDDDDMFEFEPGGLSAPPKPRERAPPPQDEDEPSDDESQDDVPNMSRPSQPTLYSTSPAVSIMRPRLENSMATVSRFQPGSLGSYKGRPVIMPVVRNPEVHARAASLGQFNTFVGGLDGRSGMDEGDLSSFRASVVQPGFTGTPRSFTERFMMEEAQAERERERNGATQ
ncbi:uncharacterized protein TRIVIDRAFT_61489 [Trichoderma virens Gv29-8]|uniref:Uncharacterized protein n=1 Tax=Hypocrea virens (strain Gv29-8 / FGSC 10586) TaxID=413071 RepID=G9MKG5_HYPVG|nr:uncharacterized protein TRIVIDRAFT_61489 [Trichoderma virens Gv29-8]EHK24713.1 hypothetical protein TRIVIDRAFT_61489 [Trichoderma virens Gv29-8]UKZ54976.1 hypothetical protein TrVGV298_008791 [Trichoderma virens]